MNFSPHPVTSSLLAPNTLPNIVVLITFNLRSSLNESDQVSHPYKTTCKIIVLSSHDASGVPRNLVRGGGSPNSVEERGQRERGSGGFSPLVRGSTQFANE
jgi:hypothetical protein